MTWEVFGGNQADVYAVLLRYRCLTDNLGTEPGTLNAQFRLHLHRGIAYLAADRNIRDIGAFVHLALRHLLPDPTRNNSANRTSGAV